MKNLTSVLTAKDHQRIINRYAMMLNGKIKTQLTTKKLVEKMEWHAAEYLSKTGELPN